MSGEKKKPNQIESATKMRSKNLFIKCKMESTYRRVLCLFILTSGLFRLNAASNLPHSHRNHTPITTGGGAQHRVLHSSSGRNNATEISEELRRQSLTPSVQRPHQIRHYHHHQHPSKHDSGGSKPGAYHHQSDDTAYQRPSHPSTEHYFFGLPITDAPITTVPRKNMPRPSTQGPVAEQSAHHRTRYHHHVHRPRPNSIDASRTTKKHGATSDDDAADNRGMLVPLRINNNNNSNRNRNNSQRRKSVPGASAPLETRRTAASRATPTKITPVRDICFIFNMPKHCGTRSNSNKAFSIQSDAGNPFDADSNALDALAAKDDDDDDGDDDNDDDDGDGDGDQMDLLLPTTDTNAFNERHLRSNKRSQRDGHSSRSTMNNLNYDEKGDNANDGWNNHRRRTAQSPTTRPIATRDSMLTLNNSPIIPGDLTQHKYKTLGTHSGVAQAREEFLVRTHNMRNSTVRNLAKQHADFIDREALCKVPRPRIISIPLHPSQSYMPPCTMLHRCSDDTGCCKSHMLKCVPKQYEIVTQYFIVSTIRGQSFIEEKHFHNHTECHCVDKTLTYEPVLKPKCQCPAIFEISYNDNNECVCDCSEDKSMECNSKKAGIEHFSIEDRRCILNGACTAPNCLYGLYNETGGGCPTVDTKFQRDID